MPRIEVIPVTPLNGSSGFAFSVRRDGQPVVLLDAGRGSEPIDWASEGAAHDIVWISHGHHDHAGALADLLQERPQLDVALPAKAAPLAAAVAQAGGMDASRAHAIYDNAQKLKFHEPVELAGFRAVCGPSGHGSGAGLLRLEVDGYAIGYTGDWALHPRSGAQPAALEHLKALDLLICECALAGAKRLDDWSQMETISELFRFFDHDGPRLAAVSAFGELQEIVALLRNRDDVMVEAGLGRFVTDVQMGDCSTCAMHLAADGLVIAHGPGLRASEPAGELSIPHVTGPSTRIALFNAVPRGSEAATILGAKRKERRTIYGENRRIRAQIRRFDFPTHATRPDLVRAICMLDPASVLLFHENDRVLDATRRAIRDAGYEGELLE